MNYWNEPCNWSPVQYQIILGRHVYMTSKIEGVPNAYIQNRVFIANEVVYFTEKVPIEQWLELAK